MNYVRGCRTAKVLSHESSRWGRVEGAHYTLHFVCYNWHTVSFFIYLCRVVMGGGATM